MLQDAVPTGRYWWGWTLASEETPWEVRREEGGGQVVIEGF